MLSDGNTVTVADTLGAALKLLDYMRTNFQWQVLASDDVTVVSINAVKGLAMETNRCLRHMATSRSQPRYAVPQSRPKLGDC